MSRHGEVTLVVGDGDHRFRLALGELRELQEKRDAGPLAIARRLQDGSWQVDDIRETIRIGLVGGGMTPREALAWVERYVDQRPLLETLPVARAILMAALLGPVDEALPGKAAAAEAATGAGPTAGSPSPSSTAPARH